LANAKLARLRRESEAASAAIGVNRRVSEHFRELVPEMEAMRGEGSSLRCERRVAPLQGIYLEEVFTFAISRVLMRFRAGLVAPATP
jgi:hypothetical protein